MSEESPLVSRWLGTIVRKNTRRSYWYALNLYLEFTGMTPEDLIDEAITDQSRDPRSRLGHPLTRLLKFYTWVQEEYGVKANSASTLVNSVRSFYANFEVYVKLKGRSTLPVSRVTNKRLILDSDQVRSLVNNSRSIRDRALIIIMFQSGMDQSTLCSLKYRDVKAGIESGEYPLMIDMSRIKTDVDYYTFLGRNSIDLLEAYIKDVEARGFTYSDSTPLFWTRWEKRSLSPGAIQKILRGVAIRAGFIEKDAPYNVAGAHSLRESFGSILVNSEVPDSIVDFLLGHKIGEMAKAYKTVQYEKVREIYLEREPLLSIYPFKQEPEITLNDGSSWELKE